MARLGLETEIVDKGVYDNTIKRFREQSIVLPTFDQLSDPATIPRVIQEKLAEIAPDEAHPLNLFRVHWYNGRDRKTLRAVPDHLVLPSELTGVRAPIVVALGDRFPMIRAHKVLAAYGCLVPRLVTGQFDPTSHRAVWPSTGNYCRGGVAISRILGCRGIAVLPEGMSRQRFAWLEDWVSDKADIIRTPGSESNVKEIYDKCAELDADPQMVIFNQFCEFGNHLVHLHCTGRALGRLFDHLRTQHPQLELAAYVSATGSAGTLAAGDALKERHGAKIVAVEALQCPTLLYNGFGEHNIQGIGDKHLPLIHNVMNTDLACAISDQATDTLDILFNTDSGRTYLSSRRGIDRSFVERLSALGYSGICNVLAAIKTAKYYDYGPQQAIFTVATDSAAMYVDERDAMSTRYFAQGFDALAAAETYGQHVLGCGTDHIRELSHEERQRIFNLGYFTWVEQQGVSLEDFTRRRRQAFWRALRQSIVAWNEMIEEFNKRVGVKL
ncbi:MAG: pyridoxal-5'-phosphate-dependent protein subunit beta [Deltaproteobacteria bacterium]|nr:pyridoxal-5'-phosphate-dependent protein subunit beta [Deltaproteobacteria bacterium]